MVGSYRKERHTEEERPKENGDKAGTYKCVYIPAATVSPPVPLPPAPGTPSPQESRAPIPLADRAKSTNLSD